MIYFDAAKNSNSPGQNAAFTTKTIMYLVLRWFVPKGMQSCIFEKPEIYFCNNPAFHTFYI